MPPPPSVVYIVDAVVYVVDVTSGSPKQQDGQARGQEAESDARETVSTRLSAAGVQAVDELAAAEDRTRSAMLRILIKEAVTARRRRRR